jgi:hypothetical protein
MNFVINAFTNAYINFTTKEEVEFDNLYFLPSFKLSQPILTFDNSLLEKNYQAEYFHLV